MTLQAATSIKTTQENGVIKTTTSESTKGTTFTTANDLCQVTYEGICFWFGLHGVQDIDFPTAQDICAQRNYEVADIYSEEHYKLIVKFLHSAIRDGAGFVSAWIGLQIDLQTNVVALSDGRVAPYVNWYRAPQLNESIHLIVSSDSHGMSSVPANTSLHAVVCQSKQLYIQIPEDRCHVEYRGLCFWASVGVTALTDFPLAQNICASAGFDVANIYDDEHHNILVEYLLTVMPSKLNLMSLWTGMRYDEEASRITFSDGNTVPYQDAWFLALPSGSATHICMILGEFDSGSTLYGTSPLTNTHGVICQTWGSKADGD